MTKTPGAVQNVFDPLPVLKSDRLLLRAIETTDIPAVVEISAYDGVLARHQSDALEFLERIKADSAKGESLHWGICSRDGCEVFGTCGYYRGFERNTGEIGYILRSAYRGRGLMTEAVRLIVDFGFRVMRLSRIIAITDSRNAGSIAVLERNGFRRLSVERDEILFVAYPADESADPT